MCYPYSLSSLASAARPFVMRDFFFEVANIVFFCFQVRFCPVKRGNRAGSSRNEFNYSRRGTQSSFLFLDCRRCKNFGLGHFSVFLVERRRLSNRAPLLINCQFSHYKIEKMSLSEILAIATLENRLTDLSTSPTVVRLIPSRAGKISSLYGAKPNLKEEKLRRNHKKKPRRGNGPNV